MSIKTFKSNNHVVQSMFLITFYNANHPPFSLESYNCNVFGEHENE
jgi:hypothetical protein